MKKIISFLLFSFLFGLVTVVAKAEVSPETVVDLFERIESLEKKTRVLTGKNEELQYQLKLLKRQQKESFLAVDERIDALSKQVVEQKKTEPKEPTPALEDDATSKEKALDSNQESNPKGVKPPESAEEKATPPKESGTNTVETPKSSVKTPTKRKIRAPSQYEKETYQAAFKLMKTSPTAATRAFQEYIKMQPDSPLAANAQYWIGEIKYSHNNYKGAVQEFIKVLQKYKSSDKAPDAAIKLGYSFYALKNWAYARRTFEDILKYFPDNKNAVNLATKRLEVMKAAGH